MNRCSSRSRIRRSGGFGRLGNPPPQRMGTRVHRIERSTPKRRSSETSIPATSPKPKLVLADDQKFRIPLYLCEGILPRVTAILSMAGRVGSPTVGSLPRLRTDHVANLPSAVRERLRELLFGKPADSRRVLGSVNRC